jgi:FtsZ-binding cell division protein ZapB
MQLLNLSDQEFRHYQELYNTDPVVQRLCQIDFVAIEELDEKIAELEDQVESLEYDNDSLRDEISELRHENKVLREKIKVWSVLEEE